MTAYLPSRRTAWIVGALVDRFGAGRMTLVTAGICLAGAVWPLPSRMVALARFGTAIGLMWVAQNAGIAGANLVAGWLNDRAGAGAANPAGYDAMLVFFGTASVLGAPARCCCG